MDSISPPGCHRRAFEWFAGVPERLIIDNAKRWVMEEAGFRRHGTTGESPLALFAVERAVLRPLPAVAPDLGVWSQVSVHRDCHVQFDRAFYSAPFTLVGKTLWLKASDGRSACITSSSRCAITLTA